MVIVHTCKYIILKGMVVIKINSGAIYLQNKKKRETFMGCANSTALVQSFGAGWF
jgi:hypothetical protein